MIALVMRSAAAARFASLSTDFGGSVQAPAIRRALEVVLCALLALFTTAAVEIIARDGLTDVREFLTSPARPGMTTIAMLTVLMLSLDAALGRRFVSALIVLPLVFVPAIVSNQKQHYLTDPLYPSDLLFGRQIIELLPVMVRDRPWSAVAMVVGIILSAGSIIILWRFAWRHFPHLSRTSRLRRLCVGVPIIAAFGSLMDYSQYSFIRDRLQVVPMMWDQKENYRSNGFILAFIFNIPMADVAAPPGFGPQALDAIPNRNYGYLSGPREKPDVIMLMSESFWDPTRLKTLTLSPDPMPTIRAIQSGYVFSPEFGGMTANVEFEALTGFSNAFLPYGSIPYQQYVRHDVPSLATFFRSQGYAARSLHPFSGWFWNRNEVYRDFGFEQFRSEETMPPMEKRGLFASDESFMKEIMNEADGIDRPFFFFAVTLQGHGPYEPNRYARNTIDIKGNLNDADRATLGTYTQGVKEADDSLKMLMDWAEKRERETIIVLWGDHLPPLGNVYTATGYMSDQVATRKASASIMKQEHETPLVIWSNKKGSKKDIGTISPSLLPYHLLKFAGFEHPYYTGFLGRVQRKYSVIDRYQLIARDNTPSPDWVLKPKSLDPLVRDYRYLQHDIMFGKAQTLDRFFPQHAWLYAQGT
ncbi:LTA synthase family protein [Rhizobium mesoamericanum]|uniref:Putative cyclic beta-1,2-glucan modification protein n=1 Tax=Rhizobium mesoamericanum STM3625 TaxID=1211777 RepID=K0PH85_9HYPH|nr:LTA synthase family protein [Rhizobium mesoamericanum]CCM75861.1 putative cyclic beta-1,2-glucan modification protein [Rhizobium mesoamericanum STM3625]